MPTKTFYSETLDWNCNDSRPARIPKGAFFLIIVVDPNNNNRVEDRLSRKTWKSARSLATQQESQEFNAEIRLVRTWGA